MGQRRKVRDLTVIVPAAGVGRRMKSYGVKALVELSLRETIISRQIRIIRSVFPKADIVVVTGYEVERLMRALPHGVKVVENERYEETNVIRSISMGLRVASYPNVLIVYSDLVFNKEAVSWANTNGSGVLIDSRHQFGDDEVGTMIVDGRVTNFSFGLPVKWGQIAYLTGRELELFRRIASQSDKRRHFGHEVLNSVIDAGGRIRAIEPRDLKIVEIDSSKDIEIAKGRFASYSSHRRVLH
jgi:choline kinase